jgi:hypothetical protein
LVNEIKELRNQLDTVLELLKSQKGLNGKNGSPSVKIEES